MSLLLLFSGEAQETIDDVITDVTVSDTAAYAVTISDAEPYTVTAGDDEAYDVTGSEASRS